MASMPSIRSREIKIVQEIPISKNLKFYEGLKLGKVYATKCKVCGKLFFPRTLTVLNASQRNWSGLSSAPRQR